MIRPKTLARCRTNPQPDDDTLGNLLEAAADAANAAEPQIPWDQIIAIESEAKAAASTGMLTSGAVEGFLARAVALIPTNRKDLLDELEGRVRGLL